jgi:hypothetical protein
MASQKQIKANQANSKRSSGPSETGKLRSRLNATKHGLTSELVDVAAGLSPEFQDRREKWGAEFQPAGENSGWAMDRAVAASFRIEECEHAIDGLRASVAERATLGWDEDRAVEAATIFGRIGRDPILASRQLQTTLAGVILLIEAWLGLGAALQANHDWSESEASKALDLLGVDPELRSGRTLIDAAEPNQSAAYRQELALEEIERLEALRDEAMIPLDEMERRHAMLGDTALLSKQAQLLLRYERDAWTRYHKAMKEVKNPPLPAPVVAAPPRTFAPAPAPAPMRKRPEWVERLIAEGPSEMTEMDREIEARGGFQAVAAEARAEHARMARESAKPLVTERTQFGDVPFEPASR